MSKKKTEIDVTHRERDEGLPKVRHLNFQVPPEVFDEFRLIAAFHRLGMRELFYACFDAYKYLHGDAGRSRAPKRTE